MINFPLYTGIVSVKITRITRSANNFGPSALLSALKDTFVPRREIIDIYSKDPYPSCVLSNFKRCKFFVDDIECSSIEGVLQSLKVIIPKKNENPKLWKERMDLQKRVCSYANNKAKRTGSFLGFFNPELKLNWRGKEMGRQSKEYKTFLKKVFEARYLSDPEFRQAIYDTKDAILTHSIGRKSPQDTVLTEQEFLEMLAYLKIKFDVR